MDIKGLVLGGCLHGESIALMEWAQYDFLCGARNIDYFIKICRIDML